MKQAIIVNEALHLPRGKFAAQAAHAAIGALLAATLASREGWLAAGMPKIVLRCDSAEALLAIEAATGRPACLARWFGMRAAPSSPWAPQPASASARPQAKRSTH